MRIYALVYEGLILYVGKTTTSLKERLRCHKKPSNPTTSRYIPTYMEYDIKLLEECSDEQGVEREQHWYDTLMPFYNNKRPGGISSEERKKRMRAFNASESHKRSKMKYRASKQ
jgi:hypothetical protein